MYFDHVLRNLGGSQSEEFSLHLFVEMLEYKANKKKYTIISIITILEAILSSKG